jgi:hypothetical protein
MTKTNRRARSAAGAVREPHRLVFIEDAVATHGEESLVK